MRRVTSLIRMRRVVLLIVCGLFALVLGSGIALATLSNKADPATIKVNGRVWSIVAVGDKIYLGGAFTQITDAAGTVHQRNNLAAIDADSMAVTAWDPRATVSSGTSQVRAMVLSPDGTRLFVGGQFTQVGGLVRNKLAAVNLDATGTVDAQWKTGSVSGGTVYALGVSGSRLYAGGDFTGVGGQPRERLAALDTTTGALNSNWTPRAHRGDGGTPATVRALHLSEDGTNVYAGGFFNHISGQQTGKLAAIDATTGALNTTFRPQQGDNVLAMDVAGGSVFVGTGDPLEGIESFNATTGQQNWSIPGGHPHPCAGDVQAIKAVVDPLGKGTVYAGGHFCQMGGLVRKRLLEVDAKTGAIGPWAPAIPGGNLGVWALEVDLVRGRLYAGGDFTKIGGVDHIRFAKFSGLPGLTSST